LPKEKTVFYTSVINDLEQRIIEHYTGKEGIGAFTTKYHCYYLLFYEALVCKQCYCKRERNKRMVKGEKAGTD
jgi:putative endonuclease